MRTLRTIEPIKKKFETAGSSPVLVHCEDQNDYVCKYDSSTRKLFCEYIAASFLDCWELKVPNFSFINVLPNHLPTEPPILANLQPRDFRKPCFGSRYLDTALDISRMIEVNIKDFRPKQKIQDRNDILKIALFDIWISNEDRHINNANLLLNPTEKGLCFTPIDHADIFNSGSSIERPIYIITEEESILFSPFIKILFRGQANGLPKMVDSLAKYFDICVDKCERCVEKIFQHIPEEWELDKQLLLSCVRQQLFENKAWKAETFNTFCSYLQIALKA